MKITHSSYNGFPIQLFQANVWNASIKWCWSRKTAVRSRNLVEMNWITIFLVVCLACSTVVKADYSNDGGFLPSTSYQRTEDQLAQPSARSEKTKDDRDSQPERTQRFGISSYGSTGSQSPYGATAPGLYGPVKIDLGGVLLGSIIGFGAVIILPKIIHAFSYGYGGYGRSAESDQLGQLSELLTRLDDVLNRYNIDSGACMQRLTCSYVQLANENVITGNASEFDAMLATLTHNSLIRRMLDGTSIMEALSAGRSLQSDCHQLYPKCEMDKKTVVKIITQLLPS